MSKFERVDAKLNSLLAIVLVCSINQDAYCVLRSLSRANK